MKTWKLLLCLAAMVLLLGVAAASAEIARGTCGGCTWTLADAGVLTIAPTPGENGVLPDSGSAGNAYPWISDSRIYSAVKKVVVQEGVKAGARTRFMFALPNLAEADVSKLDTSAVTDMRSMFWGASLTNLDLNDWDTSSLVYTTSMFFKTPKLESVQLEKWNTSKLQNIDSMFDESGIKTINLAWRDTSSLTSIYGLFEDCTSLESVDVSTWDTSNVTRMWGVFFGCTKLKTLDLSSWDTKKASERDSTMSFTNFFTYVTLDQLILGKDFYNLAADSRWDKITFKSRMFFVMPDDNDATYVYNAWSRIPSNHETPMPGVKSTYVIGRVIHYDANTGDGNMDDQLFGCGLPKKTLRPNAFSGVGGKTFTGWNTKADGTGKAYAASDLLSYESFSGDITLYAQWAPAANITFDLAGGTLDGKTGSIVLTVPKGTDITILNAPEKEGFEFQYWEGSEYYPGQTYTANEDHTFTAKWGPKPTVPKTGDAARPALYLAFAALSALALLTLGRKRRVEK